MANVNPWLFVPPVLVGALTVLFYLGLGRENADELPSALSGTPAPVLALEPLAGRPEIPAEALAAEGVKLVNFWASWCGPCRLEHPILTELAAEGVPIFGINSKDRPAAAAQFLEELGDPFAGHGADPNGRHGIDWGVYGLPETFVVDGDGRIILRYPGALTDSIVDSRIRPHLEAQNPS
ncbi:MAG: DsbE family thiol:disulfide interchange protein [Pseudomonadota bacterium]